MRIVVLVDGEHYPPVVRAALARLRAEGHEVVGAVFLGGKEKLADGDLQAAYGVAVEAGGDREAVLGRLCAARRPEAVVDLSDEPVVGPAERFRLACVALRHGARYLGPDFELRPPRFARLLTKPAVRVFATGKRTGKTAVAGALARHAVRRGRRPVIVAMGRGGPEEPVVVGAGRAPGVAELVEMAGRGLHAASDYLEDAITSGVATVGCRRVGGGLAGEVYDSNVAAGARLAEGLDADLVILEGSGAAIPPVEAQAGLICVPATVPPASLASYLGPYRLLLADVAVVTMSEEAAVAAAIESAIHGVSPSTLVVRAVLRPHPLAPVAGRKVFFCSTAPPQAGPVLRRHLEEEHGCKVVGISHGLADRQALRRDLEGAPAYEVLVTELKAAAIDVAARVALEAGREVVLADNVLVGEGIEEAFDVLVELADRRSSR